MKEIHWSDTMLRFWDALIGILALFCNASMIIIISKHTPDTLRTYSIMLLLVTFADCVTAFGSLMCSVRMIPTGDQMIAMFSGACEMFTTDRFFNAQFCMFWYAVKDYGFILSCVVLIASYVYRALVITKPFDTLKSRHVFAACVVYTLLHLCFFNYVWYANIFPIDEIDEAIAKVRPELIGSNWTYNLVMELDSPPQRMMDYCARFTPLIMGCVAFISRRYIHKFLSAYQFSDTLKELHKSLLKVLLIQTIAPIVIAFAIMLYVIISLGLPTRCTLCENLAFAPVPFLALLNPIVTCLFIAPYKKAILAWVQVSPPANTNRIPSISSTNPIS